MAEESARAIALTDLSTGEALLAWEVGEGWLGVFMKDVDEAARSAGAAAASTVDLKTGIMTESEMNRMWLDEAPRVVDEAEGVLAVAAVLEGGRENA